MNKILFASLAAISTVFGNYTPNPTLDVQYPFVMWSKTAIPAFTEWDGQINATNLVSQVHSTVFGEDGSLKATRVYIIRKDGMTTRDTLKAAKFFDYDRNDMFSHSVAFPWVESEGFTSENDSLLSQSLGVKASEYQLDSADEISILAKKLGDDTSSTLTVSIINMKHSLSNELINDISKEIQEAVIKTGVVTSHVMALTGRRTDAVVDPIISLQQTEVLAQVTTTANLKADPVPKTIKDYITHSILTGILVMFLIFFFLIVGFLQLMAVQTPTYYPTQSISFGKLEY